jgi:hypothetical protein
MPPPAEPAPTPGASPAEPARSSDMESAWEDVAQHVGALGKGLAETLRESWEREENRRRVEQIQSGIERILQEVRQAVQEAAASPKAEELRQELDRTAESVRSAGEQTADDLRPQIAAALRQLTRELHGLADRLERDSQVVDVAAAPTATEPPGLPPAAADPAVAQERDA